MEEERKSDTEMEDEHFLEEMENFEEVDKKPSIKKKEVEISLPNEDERYQILNTYLSQMKENKKIAPDVNLKEIAILTKNFNSAELEVLVKTAWDTAMNRIKAFSGMEIDPVPIDEKLVITRSDFFYALQYYIKSTFNKSTEVLRQWLDRKIITWGTPVVDILASGNLCIKVARTTGLVSVLLKGLPKSGKTTLAAQIAKNSNFPFVKICTPEDIISLDEFDNESAKCRFIRKAFDEAYCSQLSCILIDNIEYLLNYCPIKQNYSILMLQTLLVLLEKSPPPGHKLLILCTSSCEKFLSDVGLLPIFNTILDVPNLSTNDHIFNVLDEVNLFSKHKMASFKAKIQEENSVSIGIKKLLCLIDIVRQVEPSDRVEEFFTKLSVEGVFS